MPLQVYESMKEYTLQGSAVGLGPNAQHALEAVHPDLLARYSALAIQEAVHIRMVQKSSLYKDSWFKGLTMSKL